MMPISPPHVGPGNTIAPPDAAPIRCRAPNGSTCHSAPARAAVGVIGLDNDRQGPLLTPEQQRLLDALADQAALAIERVQLVADVDNAQLAEEAGQLRSALLTSISHDLKTPLAAIMGAAGTLRDYPVRAAGRRPPRIADHGNRTNRSGSTGSSPTYST